MFSQKVCIPFRSAIAAVLWLAYPSTSWSGVIQGSVLSGGKSVGHALQLQLCKRNPDTLIYDHFTNTSSSPATGAYQFTNLVDGLYLVYALDLTGEHAAEAYQDAYREADGTVIEINDGKTLIDPVNIDLQPGATISGRVVDPNGYPISDLAIGVPEMTDSQTMELLGGVGSVSTDANGEFKLGLRPGVYAVVFWDYSDDPHWATQIFSNTTANQWATPIVLSSVGQVVSNVNAVMQPGYDISGKVTDVSGKPLAGVFASFEVYDSSRMQWGTTVSKRTSHDGTYSINFPTGEYRAKFEEDSLLYEHEHWSGASEPSNATSIYLAGTNVTGINAQLKFSPLAIWAFGYGINPFANVGGWLGQDPDSDTYDNFHEFAFGTDPTNPTSGYPYIFGPTTNSTASISALINTNLSTAYWVEYELQERTSLSTGGWLTSTNIPFAAPALAPAGYIRMSVAIPTTPNSRSFFRTKATIKAY